MRLTKSQLIELVVRIQNAQDTGDSIREHLNELQFNVPHPHVGELFTADYGAVEIVERALRYKLILPQKLTEDEMVSLVEKICNHEGDQIQIDEWVELLEVSIPNPHISDLIFWNTKEMSPREIVREALQYRPIGLGGG